MNLTIEERERRAYIANAPDAAVLGEAFDADADLQEAERQFEIGDAALQEEVDVLTNENTDLREELDELQSIA